MFDRVLNMSLDYLSCDCNRTWTKNHLVHKQTLNRLVKLVNNWALLWVLTWTVHLTVCSYHVTHVFQSESTLYSCLSFRSFIFFIPMSQIISVISKSGVCFFYTHQTTGMCAGVCMCACTCMYLMDKTGSGDCKKGTCTWNCLKNTT